MRKKTDQKKSKWEHFSRSESDGDQKNDVEDDDDDYDDSDDKYDEMPTKDK